VRRRPSRFTLGLAAICLLALALRVVYVLTVKHHQKLWGDAFFYHWQADGLLHGENFPIPHLYKFNHISWPAADHPPIWTILLAGADLLGLRSYEAHKLFACVIGSGTVAAVGLVGRRIASDRAGLIAAGVAALYPNFWANDGLAQSETPLLLAVAITMLVAYRFWRRPSLAVAAGFGAAVGIAALVHPETILLGPLVGIPLALGASRLAWRQRVGRLAVMGAVTVLVISPWVARNFATFDNRVYLSNGNDETLLVSNCDSTYHGELMGYWNMRCIVDHENDVVSSDQSVVFAHYRKLALDYMRDHKRQLPKVVAVRLGRGWNLYRPFQMVHLDVLEGRELMVNRLGLFTFWILLPLAAGGVVVLRRRRIPTYPLLALAVTVSVGMAMTFGNTRYRASAEVALALLAAAFVDAVLPRRHDETTDDAPVPAPPERVPVGTVAS
jgi:4-amino-4-deoxy-L-arabinose transferase-like glycosyltransferase